MGKDKKRNMNYSYQFTLFGNVIGYSNIFTSKHFSMLNNQRTKDHALFQFCEQFDYDPFEVEIGVIPITNGTVSDNLIFEFKGGRR